MQIDIDFDVFKALTALRRNEAHTYSQVLRELLDLPVSHPGLSEGGDITSIADGLTKAIRGGLESRGLFLPNGTVLRAKYKSRSYEAVIEDGRLKTGDGRVFSSPSAAASGITQTNVNGLRFWEAKRPTDTQWKRLDSLAESGS